MDMLQELLAHPAGQKTVDPEMLEMLGTQAATLYLEKKASLNDSIVKLASDFGQLNNEHIHRIAEFANNVTFQRLFEREKNKNIHFPVADPGVIIRDLKDGGSPAHSGKVLHNKGDYLRPPIKGEQKTSFADPESGMQHLFQREEVSGQHGQGQPVEKVAAASGLDPSYEGHANPIEDVYEHHCTLKRAHQELSTEHEVADLAVKQARANLFGIVKREVLEPNGAGLGGVVAAWEKVANAPMANKELSYIVEGLIEDGVPPETLERSMRKSAGRIINQEHPLVVGLNELVKAAHSRLVLKESLQQISDGLQKTASFLKSQVG